MLKKEALKNTYKKELLDNLKINRSSIVNFIFTCIYTIN